MTRSETGDLIYRLTMELTEGYHRIRELDRTAEYGLPHTLVRERINGIVRIVESLRDAMPYPLRPNDFKKYQEVKAEITKSQSWFGWL